MKYIRVRWIHSFRDDPVLIYSELNDERWEARKVEVFPDGRLDFAPNPNGSNATGTFLGLVAFPSLDEIAKDAQFEPREIDQPEFEEMWEKAISSSSTNGNEKPA